MIPINMNASTFGTCQTWRRYGAKRTGNVWNCHGVQTGMRRFAREYGKAICMRADDSAVIMYRDTSRKSGFRVETIPADSVRWFKG